MTTKARKLLLEKKIILRIGTWIIGSWHSKEQETIAELESHNIPICAVSETKIKRKGYKRKLHVNIQWSRKAYAGVGILIQQKYVSNIVVVQYINERLLLGTMIIEKAKTHIIAVYAPDMGRGRE